MTGNILNTIRQLYSHVECAVRINGHVTPWFKVDSGVKQGCILSPLLFNLFVNDLIETLKKSGYGVNVGCEKVACLAYADDIALLAETEQDLQNLLDITFEWCEAWHMKINTLKTKIMHFRQTSARATNFIFKIDNCPVDIVPTYKYLELMLSYNLDFKVTAELVAKSAHRALGLLIVKSKAHGGMPFNCFKKLYDALVQPIINYGASIWGASEFSCINSVQNKACKFFLGIGKYAPNAAAQCDMGWKMSLHRQWECVLRLKLRLMKLPDIRINKRIYVWSESMSCKRVSNWNYKVTDMLNTLEMHRFVDPNIHINI